MFETDCLTITQVLEQHAAPFLASKGEEGEPAAGESSAADRGVVSVAGRTIPTKTPANPLREVQQFVGGIMGLMSLPTTLADTALATLTNPLAKLFSAPAATQLSMFLGPPHSHPHPPACNIPALPSIGMVMFGNCVRVLIGGFPAARAGDLGLAPTCTGLTPFFEIYTGSSNVYIGGTRAARMLDLAFVCGKGEPPKLSPKMLLGPALDLVGIGADLLDAAAYDEKAQESGDEGTAAMASAMGLQAAMGAAQLASDLAATAMRMLMGLDPGTVGMIPPLTPGMPKIPGVLLTGTPTVMIGGLPIPNDWTTLLKGLLKKLLRLRSNNGGCGTSKCPIDNVTGANVDVFTDYERTGSPLLWRRYYYSLRNGAATPLGRGFRHEFQHELRADVDGFLYTGPQGAPLPFPALAADGDSACREGLTLTRRADGRYRLAGAPIPELEYQLVDVQRPLLLVGAVTASGELAFAYDELGRLSAMTAEGGERLLFSYNPAGQIAQVRHQADPHHESTLAVAEYEYDEQGCLRAHLDAYRHRAKYDYDLAGRMTRKANRRGFAIYYRYDDLGRCVHTWGDEGRIEGTFEYLPDCTIVTDVDSGGGRWIYRYNECGTINQIIDPYGGLRRREVNDQGQLVREIDAAGNVTELLYDDQGAHTRRRDPLGNLAPPLTDFAPRPPEPLTHRMPETPAAWCLGGLAVPLRARTASAPMLIDRARAILAAHVVAELAAVSPAEPVREEYDRLGRRQSRTVGSTREQWEYDANGHLSAYRDRDNSLWRYEHAAYDKRLQDTSPLGQTARYSYAKTGELEEFTDAGGTVTRYEHDFKNRVVAIYRSGALRERYEYDHADNLVAKYDSQGQKLLELQARPGNLVGVRKLASGDTHRFEYDDQGRYTLAATDALAVRFAYDGQGRRTCDERDGLGVRHEFRGLRLTRSTILSRFTVAYQELSPIEHEICDPTGARHRLMLSSGLALLELANGTSELSRYDSQGRCVGRAAKRRGGALHSRTYVYSVAGDLVSTQDAQHGQTVYRYDAAHRLCGEQRPDGESREYRYDVADNLVEQPGLTGVRIGPGNRLLEANHERFAYDHRHQVSERSSSQGTWRYTYDSRDLLIRAHHDSGEDWQATYDPLGRRIEKRWSGGVTRYYWDTDRLAAESLPSGRLRIYVYANEKALVPLLFVEYKSSSSAPEEGERYYIFTDQLGTPERIEDDCGTVVWSAEISPYGVSTVKSADIPFALRFPGHYFDDELELQYNRFRYYVPSLGRYIQTDPIGLAGGNNLYAYTPRPLQQVDLRGLNSSPPNCDGGKNTVKEGEREDGSDTEKKKKTSHEVGKEAEELVQKHYEELGFELVGGQPISKQHTGIDLIFKNHHSPPGYIIVEVKYNRSQVNVLSDGTRQTSDPWIQNNLSKSVNGDPEKVAHINNETYDCVVVKVKPGANGEPDKIQPPKKVDEDGYVDRKATLDWYKKATSEQQD